MLRLELIEPYCPLCQLGFTSPGLEAYKLMCNHLVCQYCLHKMQVESNAVVCYFDKAITQAGSEMLLQGLGRFLIDCAVEVESITMGTATSLMDQKLMHMFNLRYERAKIMCRTKSCNNKKCLYDHTGRFYKKTECPYGTSCPNSSTCIFVHPLEIAQQDSGLVDTPLPQIATNSLNGSTPAQASQYQDQSPQFPHFKQYQSNPTPPNSADPSAYYTINTPAQLHPPNPTLRFQNEDAQTIQQYPGSEWQCKNCGMWVSGLNCSQCSLFYH